MDVCQHGLARAHRAALTDSADGLLVKVDGGGSPPTCLLARFSSKEKQLVRPTSRWPRARPESAPHVKSCADEAAWAGYTAPRATWSVGRLGCLRLVIDRRRMRRRLRRVPDSAWGNRLGPRTRAPVAVTRCRKRGRVLTRGL